MYDRLIVSVIIPAHNAGASLADAVSSALMQSGAEIEVVIVDDKSSDNTLAIARTLAADDDRVRVVENEENTGPGESRNRAMAAARGEWLALLDADDRWLAGRLERLVPHLVDADVASDDVLIREPGGRTRTLLATGGFGRPTPARLAAADLARHQLGLLKPMIRRSFLEEHGLRFDPTLRIGEDFCLFVDLLLAGARWMQTGDATYEYRPGSGSVTAGRREHLRGRLESDTRLLERPGVRADPELRALLERRVAWLVDLDRLLAARERGGRSLARALVADPRLARTAARHAYHVARRRLRGRGRVGP